MLTHQCPKDRLVGALEAGGTKFNCAFGNHKGDVITQASFATTSPYETLSRVSDFFEQGILNYGAIKALGIAHFGPIEIDIEAENYGKILQTTKPGWSHTDIVGYFSKRFNIPVAFQTDVNGAAIGEHYFGAAKKIDDFVYITVGTGIGGGVFVNGQLLNSPRHPEIGHMLVPLDRSDVFFQGCCPFHDNCLEGLASGPAIASRWGKPAEELTEQSLVWELEAHYLAILCVNLSYCYAPEKIVFGGGVMQQKQLLALIRKKFLVLMQGYMPSVNIDTVDDYIVPSQLPGEAAIKGAFILAEAACLSHHNASSVEDNYPTRSREMQ